MVPKNLNSTQVLKFIPLDRILKPIIKNKRENNHPGYTGIILVLKRKKLNIVTTQNKRGGVITRISNYFGYDVLRLPDSAADGNYIYQLKNKINKTNNANLVLSVDGPQGPEHEIKDFAMIMALFTKREILPLTVDVKHSLKLNVRWDKLQIPLPFNKITINIKSPFKIEKKDRKEKFTSLKKEIKKVMEH